MGNRTNSTNDESHSADPMLQFLPPMTSYSCKLRWFQFLTLQGSSCSWKNTFRTFSTFCKLGNSHIIMALHMKNARDGDVPKKKSCFLKQSWPQRCWRFRIYVRQWLCLRFWAGNTFRWQQDQQRQRRRWQAELTTNDETLSVLGQRNVYAFYSVLQHIGLNTAHLSTLWPITTVCTEGKPPSVAALF